MSKKRIIEEQATTDIFNDDWLVKDSGTQGTTKIQPSVFKAWINDGMATEEDIETIVENIADTYSTSESYAEGDLCIHEYALFKCIGATTGTWDSTKWEATTIAEIISTIDLSAEAISYDNASSGLEAENVQDAIDETITKVSAVGSASGDIATFTDGSALPMLKLKVAIEPQQEGSGEPSPTNVRPIIGWDEVNVGVVGKNLSKSQTNNSVLCSAKKGVTYTVSFEGNVGANIKKNTNSGEVVILGAQLPLTFTADEDFNIFLNAWNANISNIQVEVGNQATTYEPYNGQTYTIDLDGTRYGGTLDVVSGVLTVDREYVDLGDLTWSYNTNASVFTANVSNMKLNSTLICSQYTQSEEARVESLADKTIWNKGYAFSPINVVIKDLSYTDISTFKNYLQNSNAQLVYTLATPQTIQLTPTQVKSLLGVNNVWADCGDVDVSYVRDLTTTINYILEQLNS